METKYHLVTYFSILSSEPARLLISERKVTDEFTRGGKASPKFGL